MPNCYIITPNRNIERLEALKNCWLLMVTLSVTLMKETVLKAVLGWCVRDAVSNVPGSCPKELTFWSL